MELEESREGAVNRIKTRITWGDADVEDPLTNRKRQSTNNGESCEMESTAGMRDSVGMESEKKKKAVIGDVCVRNWRVWQARIILGEKRKECAAGWCLVERK